MLFFNLRAESDDMTKAELIEIGREWLEHSPPATPGPDDLAGWTDPLDICAPCASRIVARGCDLRMLAARPVWVPDERRCDLCGIHVATSEE